MPVIEAWSPEQELIEEKTALGFYLSGHPYLGHKDEVAQFVRGTLADLAPQDQPKLLAGVVMGVRVRMTQRGKMAIVTLDDAVARAEVVVGGELLAEHAHLIKEDQLLVVEGQIRHDDFSGGNRINARKLFNLPAARSHYASILKIACNGQSDAAKLTSILAPYRKGEASDKKFCPIKIEYHNNSSQASIMLGDSWRVELHDELIQHLESWLSKENVKILYN